MSLDLDKLDKPALRAQVESLRREVSELRSAEQLERVRANFATARVAVAEAEVERLRAMLAGKP